jgi:hypothetical protein
MQTQPHPSLATVMIGAVLALALAAPAAIAAPSAEPPVFPSAVPSQPGELTGSQGTEAARAQERYYTSYGDAAPLSSSSTTSADTGGVDWTAIGVSLGATVMLVGAVVALIMRTRRRTHGVRVAV